MTKYLISRIFRSLISVVIVVAVIMIMIYTFLDKQSIFASDPVYTKQKLNSQKVYQMQQWEQFGYLDYVSYADYLEAEHKAGRLDDETYKAASSLGQAKDGSNDTAATAACVEAFMKKYDAEGYEVERLEGIKRKNKWADGGRPQLYAYKDIPVYSRLFSYLGDIFQVDNIHTVQEDVGERGLDFTLYDPAYGGDTFSPAIIGNGTQHKYLLYFDGNFPYIHQNLLTINLGKSYSVTKGVDVFNTMTDTQGSYVKSMVTYPTGVVEETADDIHTATYAKGSRESSDMNQRYYVDDYTNVSTVKNGMSRMGYSFVIGIIAVFLSYLVAIPLGIVMALRKDKWVDKLGTFYIVSVTAVPSLAYIFMFRSLGGGMGLPTTFNMEAPTWTMYVLPVISLALPSIANLMKWLRRYMIDQMNSDYVKFARSGGLSEGEIFRKHILKNAIIPIVHGIPARVLGALTGAIITERVYVVPGIGNVLTTAINAYDNGVIVGVALFYALLTVTSVILGDVLKSVLDPRISFTTKAR